MDTTQVYGITIDENVRKQIRTYVESKCSSTEDKIPLLYGCICDHVLATLSSEQANQARQANRIKEGVYEKLYNDLLGKCLKEAFNNSY